MGDCCFSGGYRCQRTDHCKDKLFKGKAGKVMRPSQGGKPKSLFCSGDACCKPDPLPVAQPARVGGSRWCLPFRSPRHPPSPANCSLFSRSRRNSVLSGPLRQQVTKLTSHSSCLYRRASKHSFRECHCAQGKCWFGKCTSHRAVAEGPA